jgi:hypothetical protein
LLTENNWQKRVRIRIHRIHMFLGLLDPDPDPLEVWIRILLSLSKYSKKNSLISTVLCLLFDFLSLKNDLNVPSNSNMQKTFFLN